MPGISRVGVDTAGGTITGALVPSVTVNGAPIAVVGASVSPHGRSPHNSAVMVSGSGSVTAGGISVCRAGDLASCGHKASGSSNVSAGG